MKPTKIRIVAAGVPRSYQKPFPDGRWLTDRHIAAIKSVSDRIELIHTSRGELEAGRVPDPGADVLLVEATGRSVYKDELPLAAFSALVTPNLRWLQACSSGVGHILELDLLPADVQITKAAGVHAAALAESIMAAILVWVKQLELRRENQNKKIWEELLCSELRDKEICIIGTGHIGTETARRARAFGLRTVGVRRSADPCDHFDEIFRQDRLIEALPSADFVVIACPLTAETEGMIGSRELKHMKRGAYLINIARGLILQDDAVLAALECEQLGGAYLDAFHPEPLPADHPYWTAKNVTLIPHDSHSSQFIGDNIVELFCANLRRWIAGEPLVNLIDRGRGY